MDRALIWLLADSSEPQPSQLRREPHPFAARLWAELNEYAGYFVDQSDSFPGTL